MLSSRLKPELLSEPGLSLLPYSVAKNCKADSDRLIYYYEFLIFICAQENGLKFSMESADRKVNNYAK